MPNEDRQRPAGNTLLFASMSLTLAMMSGVFAITEHKPYLWFLAATALLLMAGRIQQALRHPRKELETLNQ